MISCILLTGCGHEHTFSEATCTEPKTCSECGETEGEALGHTWVEATCTEPKTCSVCGATEGKALEHIWIEATYDAPKTCELCGLTEGEPLEKAEEIEEPQKFTDETPFDMTAEDRQLLSDLGATEAEINSVKTQGDLQKLLDVIFERNLSKNSGSSGGSGGGSIDGDDSGIEGNDNDLPTFQLEPGTVGGYM